MGPRAADSRPYKGAQANRGVGPGSIGPCKRAETDGRTVCAPTKGSRYVPQGPVQNRPAGTGTLQKLSGPSALRFRSPVSPILHYGFSIRLRYCPV